MRIIVVAGDVLLNFANVTTKVTTNVAACRLGLQYNCRCLCNPRFLGKFTVQSSLGIVSNAVVLINKCTVTGTPGSPLRRPSHSLYYLAHRSSGISCLQVLYLYTTRMPRRHMLLRQGGRGHNGE